MGNDRPLILFKCAACGLPLYAQESDCNDDVTLCGRLTESDELATSGNLRTPERRQRGSLALAGFGAAAVFEPWEIRGVVYQSPRPAEPGGTTDTAAR